MFAWVFERTTKDDSHVLYIVRFVWFYRYTSKLQRMIQDIATSRDINVEFRESLSDAGTKLPLDFSVNVLATVHLYIYAVYCLIVDDDLFVVVVDVGLLAVTTACHWFQCTSCCC